MKNQGTGCALAVLAVSVVAVGGMAIAILGCGGLVYFGSMQPGRRPDVAVNRKIPAVPEVVPAVPKISPVAEEPVAVAPIADPAAEPPVVELPEAVPAAPLTPVPAVATPSVPDLPAYFRNEPPQAVCRYLEADGHKTGTYKKELGLETYGTCSQKRDIGGGVIPNNIAYYVEGDMDEATELRLVLNVSQRALSRSAHSELLSTSRTLVNKATGNAMPQNMREAIEAGEDGVWRLGLALVRLERDNWPTGRGYSLNLIIE